MSKQQITRVLTVLLWSSFLLCNLVLFASAAVQVEFLSILLLLLLFVCELALLLRYARLVGQWRSILLFWGVYVLARIAATALAVSGMSEAVTFAMLVALYTMFAGWFAIVTLAIRRDVSIAYLVIVFAVGPILLRGQVMASGSVLAWLQGPASSDGFQAFTLLEPAFMAMSCMVTIALLTFVPHFLWLMWREWRGTTPLVPDAAAPALEAMPQSIPPAGSSRS